VRVPRRIQELNLEVRDAMATLSQELGRAPTTDEIARRAGVDVEDVIESMEAGSMYRLASLDASTSSDDDWEPSSWLAVEDRDLVDTEDRLTVEELLGLLPEREQRIMYLRFFEGLTQSGTCRLVAAGARGTGEGDDARRRDRDHRNARHRGARRRGEHRRSPAR